MILTQYKAVLEKIDVICRRCGRSSDDIIVVGVTKYTDASAIKEALEAGLFDVAENRVQDAVQKFDEVGESIPFRKHLIGHLQSNKVKQAVGVFDLIHSVDSVKLIREIQKYASKIDKIMHVLVQVNVSGEEQKYGCSPNEIDAILQESTLASHVKVKGLMTMAPLTQETQVIRDCFSGLKVIYDGLSKVWKGSLEVEMRFLSMGMSGDYEIAIEEGANMLRIGSAIFKESIRG